MASRIEVQRVLLACFVLWLLAGVGLGDPLWWIVVRAGAVTSWAFLLGWSLTLNSPWARAARVTIGLVLAAGCAAAFGASGPAVLGVAVAVGGALGAAERLVRRRVTA